MNKIPRPIKTILPSLKEKKRYIVFEIISKEKLEFRDVKNEIKQQILSFVGELGYGKAGIQILDDLWKNQRGVIRVNNKWVNNIKSTLALIKKIKNEKIIVKTIGISGTLKKTKEKYLGG